MSLILMRIICKKCFSASRDLRDEEKRLIDRKNEIELDLQRIADEERALSDSAERSERLSFEKTRAFNVKFLFSLVQ